MRNQMTLATFEATLTRRIGRWIMPDDQKQESHGRIAGRERLSPEAVRRSLADLRTSFARRRSRGEMVSREREIYRADTTADVTSVRAKSSRHGKSTADKWNR
jgi:hypothetical protein